MFDIRYQYALHTTSFIEQPLSDRTLGRFRERCITPGAFRTPQIQMQLTGKKQAKNIEAMWAMSSKKPEKTEVL